MRIGPHIQCIKIGLLLLALLAFGTIQAQEVQVPIDVQVPLFLKATRYDRNFAVKQDASGTMTIGLCYQQKLRQSVLEMEKLKQQLEQDALGYKIKVIPIAITETEDLSQRKEWEQLSVLYLTSMRGVELSKLLALAQTHAVLTVCTDPTYVSKGVSMGFDLLGGRPHFVINRAASLKEGCDFSSQLLKMASVL